MIGEYVLANSSYSTGNIRG